jgi:hypothetical protein
VSGLGAEELHKKVRGASGVLDKFFRRLTTVE